MKRKIGLYIILLNIIILLSGCVDFFGPSAPKHDTLVIPIDDDTFDLTYWDYIGVDISALSVLNQIYSFLGLLAPGDVIAMPGLAESWFHNTNRTEWTYTLREGLTFHDGSKITAEDIEYSFKAAAAYTKNPVTAQFFQIDNVTDPAFEQKYFNFTYDSPESLTFTISSTTWFPDPMFEWDFSGLWSVYAIVPKNCFETNSSQKAFRKKPISAGPYMLSSENDTVPGESITLTRFDNWFGWGQTFTASNSQEYTFPTVKKAFKYIKFVVISDSSVQILSLQTGEIDLMIDWGLDTPPASKTAYQQLNSSESFFVYTRNRVGGAILNMNIQGNWPTVFGGSGNYPVSETWFRKAIAHAIDRQTVVDIAYQGNAVVRNSVFPSWILDRYPNLNTTGYYNFDFDVNRAEQLLDSAGYFPLGFADEPDNRFGYGLYANETTLDGVNQTQGRHFKLLANSEGVGIPRAREIQRSLRTIGIYIDVIIPNWGNFMDLQYGTPGRKYNNETIPQPDPTFDGGSWDFVIFGSGDAYNVPSEITNGFWRWWGFTWWYVYGEIRAGWFNEEYEIQRVKIYGGEPGYGSLWEFMDPPADMPPGGYSIPEWSNNDSQYIDSCSITGRILSNELPSIPILWYLYTVMMNSRVKQVLISSNTLFHVAYAYWD